MSTDLSKPIPTDQLQPLTLPSQELPFEMFRIGQKFYNWKKANKRGAEIPGELIGAGYTVRINFHLLRGRRLRKLTMKALERTEVEITRRGVFKDQNREFKWRDFIDSALTIIVPTLNELKVKQQG